MGPSTYQMDSGSFVLGPVQKLATCMARQVAILIRIRTRSLLATFSRLVRLFYNIVSLRLRTAVKRSLTGQEQLTHSAPVGRDVFEVTSIFKTKATLDDCDWNLHLSNSSYAKV